jgi:hypothetical protein
MSTGEVVRRSVGWNAGGWFGTQLGCTVWLLPLGVGLVPEDVVSGVVALAGFAACNMWGWALWRRRVVVPAHTGVQILLGGVALVVAAVVLVANARVPSVYLPYWAMAAIPVLMAFLLVVLPHPVAARREGR